MTAATTTAPSVPATAATTPMVVTAAAKPDAAEQGKPERFTVDPNKRAERKKQFRELGVKI